MSIQLYEVWRDYKNGSWMLNLKLDCLLFLSAPFGRTWPQYQRMVRLNNGQLVFAKEDASGKIGKIELGRKLHVIGQEIQ